MSLRFFGNSWAVILTLLAGLIFPALANAGPQEIVENWVASANNYKAFSVRHGGVSVDEQTQITTISDFKISVKITPETLALTGKIPESQSGNFASYTIQIPELRFTDLKKDNGYYTARLIETAKYTLNFKIISSADTVSNKIRIEGLAIRNARWSQLPELKNDPGKPASRYYPLIAALTDISFSSAEMSGGSGIQSSENSTAITTTAYGPTVYSNAIRGDYASMKISEMTITTEQAQGNDEPISDVVIGEITATNYNVGTLIRSFDPANWQPGEKTPRPIMGNMTFGKITVNAGNVAFSIDSVAVEDVAIRPSATLVLATLDGLIGQFASGAGDPDPLTIVNMVTKFYGAFELGKQTITGASFNIIGEADGKLERMVLAEVSSDGIGEFSVQGIVFSDAAGATGKVGQFAMKNLKFPSLKALIGLEAAQENGDIIAMLQAIPALEEITLKDFRVNLPRVGVISAGEETLTMGGYIGPIPTSISLKISNLLLPVMLLDPKERKAMTALGYDNIGMSLTFNASWDEATKNLGMVSSTILNDGGTFDAKVDIGGIPRKVFENPLIAQSILPLITFKSASAKFGDNSIVNRVLKMMAAQQGIKTDVFRQQIIGAVPFALQKLNNAQFISTVTRAVTNLLTNGGAISVTAQPADPISLLGLAASVAAAPGAAVEMLNLEVSND